MKKLLIILGLSMPILTFANPMLTLATDFGTFWATIFPVSSGLAVIFFFWGLAKFIWYSGDEKKRDEGKGVMTWGVVAMFILVTIWGILGFLQQSLGNFSGPTGDMHITLPGISTY